MRYQQTMLAALLLILSASVSSASEYRVPDNPNVVALLTANQVPEVLFNGESGRVVFIHQETLVPLSRIAGQHRGLAGYWIDPDSRSSGYRSRAHKVEVLDARTGAVLANWQPQGEPTLDYVDISQDGRYLSAVSFRENPARLVLYDIERGLERTVPVLVNPAFGAPCHWLNEGELLCSLVPMGQVNPPVPFSSPNIMDHPGGVARTRTYSNLLSDAYDDNLFEYLFSSTLARVGIDGKVKRMSGSTGLLARVQPSPDDRYALVIRLKRPYSHLLKAVRFPRQFELWDLETGEPVQASALPQQEGITSTRGKGFLKFEWRHDTGALGWVESRKGGGRQWVALDPPYTGKPAVVYGSEDSISDFGWTDKGTPYFARYENQGTEVSVFVIGKEGEAGLIWEGAVKDIYGDPGSALGTDGDRGPVLEYKRHVFLASDGLGPEGPQPYLDALNLDTLETTRLATADEGEYERVVGMVDPATRTILSIRESETKPPQLFSVTDGKRTPLGEKYNPFPQLDGVERRNVSFDRKDGVLLTGMLYLPRNRDPNKPLPTLVWIYPAEYTDEEYAEQVDSRRYRFHRVREASPLAAVLEGYAVLLNPTVPIIGEGLEANDQYLTQLASSMEAAIDFLVESGIADRERIAVAGRSYGAFSTANLLAHTDLFRTGIAISGAYNRTLTPFGFQHEKRSLWEATDFYTRISPFYYADKVTEPLLIMHGEVDDNPGTPPLQAQRYFHALVGNGTRVRYVELPGEQHHYRARENVLHASAEMLDWLDQTIGKHSPVALP